MTTRLGLHAPPGGSRLRTRAGLGLMFGLALAASPGGSSTVAGSPAPADPEGRRPSALESALAVRLDRIRTASGFPGATLAVALPGDRIVAVASGEADPDGKRAMDPSSRMLAGSVGKTFVAAIALQLVAEGKLDLDAPIGRYLGKEPWFARLPNRGTITVRMLLSHRSGLPRYVLKPEFWAKLREDPDRTFRPEERVAYVLDDAPVHEAGKGWAYSDTNYILVGMILEKVSGASYGSELERRILKPCALASTEPSVRRSLAGLAVGHTGDRKAPFLLPARVVEEGRYAINPQFEWTGGGLVTTARDLARWAYLLYGGAVLGQTELDAMLEAGETGAGFRYGLGAMLWESDHGPLVGHAGIMPGYESIVVYSRRGEFSLALQINADSTSGKLDRPMIVYVRELLPDVVRYLASTPGAVPR